MQIRGKLSTNPALPMRRIEASHGWRSLRLDDLWAHRELIYFLTWRDIKVRYKQTILGGAWALLQPLLTMLLFTLFFGRLAHVPSEGVPYALFAYAGLVPWTFFSYLILHSSTSLEDNRKLLTSVAFPRLVLPLSVALSGLVDFALAFLLLLPLLPLFHVVPGVQVVFLPYFLVLLLVAAVGVGLWLAALSAEFRDVRYTVPFLTQIWLFATPIAYPSTLMHATWRPVYALNPMVGVVEGFRWSLLNTAVNPGSMVAVSTCTAAVLFFSGALFYRRMERTFADTI